MRTLTLIKFLIFVLIIANSNSLFAQSNSNTSGAVAQIDSTKSLEAQGWSITGDYLPDDNSGEKGIIKYSLTLDEQGKVTNIFVIESTISTPVEKKYRKKIKESTFKWSGTGSAKVTKGVFEIRI